ncbi:MAG: serine protease [Gemmataceae bacterium]
MLPLLLPLLAAADPAPAARLPIATRWQVVTATARLSEGDLRPFSASAVCVGCKDGFAYLLTASHAAPESKARVFDFFTKDSHPQPARQIVGGEYVARQPEADLLLVKVEVGADPVPVLRLAPPGQRPTPARLPVTAFACGCPEGVAPEVRTEALTGKRLLVRGKGEVAFFWQTDTAPVGGMSGGPLVDAEGRVIGLCTAAQGGHGYYAHADEVLAFLKKSGYGWLIDAPVGR